jgi:hypothetical protein
MKSKLEVTIYKIKNKKLETKNKKLFKEVFRLFKKADLKKLSK